MPMFNITQMPGAENKGPDLLSQRPGMCEELREFTVSGKRYSGISRNLWMGS